MSYQNAPTDKQLRYIESLARDAGLGGDAWDHFPGMSRSKAQRKASAADASEVIERLQVLSARKGLPIGAVHDGHVRLPGAGWIKLAAGTIAAYQERAEHIAGRMLQLEADFARRKAAGEPKPFLAAVLAVTGADAVSEERRGAIAQIHALMAQHGISLADLDAPAHDPGVSDAAARAANLDITP